MITRIEIEGYDIEWQRDMRLGFFPTYVVILLNKEKINN